MSKSQGADLTMMTSQQQRLEENQSLAKCLWPVASVWDQQSSALYIYIYAICFKLIIKKKKIVLIHFSTPENICKYETCKEILPQW